MDKKLNEVTTASDAAYVIGTTSSGDTVRISKADLASVVGELIGTATTTKNGLIGMGERPIYVKSMNSGSAVAFLELKSAAFFLLIHHPWRGYGLYAVLVSSETGHNVYHVKAINGYSPITFYANVTDTGNVDIYVKNGTNGSMVLYVSPITAFTYSYAEREIPSDATEITV